MNVTTESTKKRLVYGASYNTNPANLAAGKALNFASGASIQKPEVRSISVLPVTQRFQDEVGLFGAENHFIKIDLNIIGDVVNVCYEEADWFCGGIDPNAETADVNDFNAAVFNLAELPTVNTYEDATYKDNDLPDVGANQGYISVELINNKTGNHFMDGWLDVRLYSITREEHPFEKMYVQNNSCFYIGFHARNTKRLTYDVSCVIGREYRGLDSIENSQLVMRTQ